MVALIAVPSSAWIAASISESNAIEELRGTVHHRLDFYHSNLARVFEKHGGLPLALTRNRDIDLLLNHPSDRILMVELSQVFKGLATAVGALAIFLMDREGLVIASSNYDEVTSFVGESLAFRHYLQDALRTGVGYDFAIGINTGIPGYFIAYSIRDGNGAVALKVGVDEFEKMWQQSSERVVVTDRYGVIFLTNVPAWRYRSLTKLDSIVAAQLNDRRQYGGKEIIPLSIASNEKNLLTLDDHRFLVQATKIAGKDWTLHVMADTATTRYRIINAALFAGLSALIIILMFALFIKRRLNLRDYILFQTKAKEELERQVRERTAELVQAGKLAALGQLAAGIVHEINQPVAAIRSFADNSRVFLERGQTSNVAGNLNEIITLTERLATITAQLKRFARKPTAELGTVDLIAALKQALNLMAAPVQQEKISLVSSFTDEAVWVVGEDVRLQQVLVNILKNAIDAVKNCSSRVIELTTTLHKDSVSLAIRDNGAGIATPNFAQVFEPFYTTKPVGEGLGLGLSISLAIVREFGGTLTALNHSDGGAVFTLTLKRTDSII